MSLPKAYDEIVDFIAAGTTPQNVIAFRPSEASRRRAWELVEREKTTGISPEEASELEHYLQLEHIMRMAEAGAQRYAHSASS